MRPRGRSLVDFGELGAAEKRLLDACAVGRIAQLAAKQPVAESVDNRVRAEFLRFLALGGDEGSVVHEKGVQLVGGWVLGDLDLEFCDVGIPLRSEEHTS